MAAVQVFVFMPCLSCKQYVKPGLGEVCSRAIYHRHPGFSLCLITPGSTKSQSASGPAAGVGGHCVFALAHTAHIFPSTFNDGTAYRMPFLFKKVKESDWSWSWKGKTQTKSAVWVFCCKLHVLRPAQNFSNVSDQGT